MENLSLKPEYLVYSPPILNIFIGELALFFLVLTRHLAFSKLGFIIKV